MRRVRQTVKGPSPPSNRMFAAVALSAALHVVLICGFSLPVISDSGTRLVIINAWVTPAYAPVIPRRSNTPERRLAPNILQPAAEPSLAGQPVAEPASAPSSDGVPVRDGGPVSEEGQVSEEG